MPEYFTPVSDLDHPLRNEEEISRILLDGTAEEFEALSKFHGFTPEQAQKLRDEARARERVRLEIRAKTMDRELFGPPPTPEETELGEFSEVVRLLGRERVISRAHSQLAQAFRQNAEAPHAYLASHQELDDLLEEEKKAAGRIVQNLDTRQLEAVRMIERLNLGAGVADALKLMVCGLKPATTFSFDEHTSSEDRRHSVEELRRCGLSVLVHRRTGKDDETHEVLAARDADTVERLGRVSPAKDHEEYGKLMGFPPSAVSGYMTGRLLTTSPSDIDPKLVMPMRLSQAHWPEELRLAARWGYVLDRL